MARAAAIIIQNDSVALIKRQREDRLYYLFPGGQIEQGETHPQTVTREIKEELGLNVIVGPLIAEVVFKGKSQYHYLATVTGGTFGTGDGAEMRNLVPSEYGTYTPVWVQLTDLPLQEVHPKFVSELVLKSQRYGWPQKALLCRDGD